VQHCAFVCFSASGSSQFIAYWAADSTALQAANFLGSLLFTLPLYYIAGLRTGSRKLFAFANYVPVAYLLLI
jgi:hypothetical protein